MKTPAVRFHSVGEITSWAKQFLNGIQKAGIAEIVFETNVAKFCETSSAQPAIALVENAPDMKQVILKIRKSGRPALVLWYGKLFSKDDMAFALENRVYAVLENPRIDDKKLVENLRRLQLSAENVQSFERHFHLLKSLLVQGEADESANPLLTEMRTVVSKLEKTGLQSELLRAPTDVVSAEGPSVPFHKAQSFSDALTTVHELERTGTLWVKSAEQKGCVQFLQGKIVGAAVGEVRGEKAIYRMFLWDDPGFSFNRVDPDDTIFDEHMNVSLKQICPTGEDLRQRFSKIRRELPPPDLRLELEPNSLHAGTQLSSEDFSTLTSIVEFKEVGLVLDSNPLPDVALLEALIRLRRGNMIRVAA